jgi:hypothetical protein
MDEIVTINSTINKSQGVAIEPQVQNKQTDKQMK